MKRLLDVGDFLYSLHSGDRIVLHSGCAEPSLLGREIARNADRMRGVRVLTLMPMGKAPYGDLPAASSLMVETFFPGRGLRAAFNGGLTRPYRVPMSALPGLFEIGALHANVLMLQTSPPDADGYVSLGVSVDYMWAVLAQAPVIIAEINTKIPHTCGRTRLHVSRIEWFVVAVDDPPYIDAQPADEVEEKIARHVASLIPDGAVIQAGIGSLPDRVFSHLSNHKSLGLHTGIITDGARSLIESGVIDNSRKKAFRGISVTAMAGGSQTFYDFLHQNKEIEFHPNTITHDRATLAGIERLYALNSVLQIDLKGRANAEIASGRAISMPGGLPDFARGAAESPGGASVLMLRSTSNKGRTSNIVLALDDGAPETVPPNHVNLVVTEYGVADLRGLKPSDRAKALVEIAHPDYRETLLSQSHADLVKTRS